MAKKERELPEVLEIDFIICDNTVNRYGWRLLVEGIELEGFLKNPVCCVHHTIYMVPVGKWKNLRVEGEELKGTVEFDKNDEDAVKLYWKYKDGFMNAVSLNVLPLEESDEDKYIVANQKYSTLIRSELLEISVVTIPGQKNAVKLSTPEGDAYKLHLITKKKKIMDKEEKTIDQLKQELDTQKKLNAENLVLRHKTRGVVQDGEVDSLKELAFTAYETVSKMLDARQTSTANKSDDTTDAKAKALVALHFNRGAITEPEVKIFEDSAKLDYESTKKVLEEKQGTEIVKSFVQGLSSGVGQTQLDDRAGWDYYEYFKKDPQSLALMEKNEPEKYKKLVADFHAKNGDLGING